MISHETALQMTIHNLIVQINKERAETTARIAALEARVAELEQVADDERTPRLERNEKG